MKYNFNEIKSRILPGWFFETIMGSVPRILGATIRHAACPNCGPSSDSSIKVSIRGPKWHCFSCLKSGDVLDAASLYWGMDYIDAAKRISEFSPQEISTYRVNHEQAPKVVRDYQAINTVIEKLKAAKAPLDSLVLAYLLKRGISQNTINEAIKQGVLISLPASPWVATKFLSEHVGRDLLEKAGMWKKGLKCPTIAFRPLGFISEKSEAIEFRVITEGQATYAKALRYGPSAFWRLTGSECFMVTEGCIDMLSARDLSIDKTLIALPGAKNWKPEWLEIFRNKAVMLALDNDKAGNESRDALVKSLTAIGADVQIYSIPLDIKDLNDYLRSLQEDVTTETL